jgi:hypothetical protein
MKLMRLLALLFVMAILQDQYATGRRHREGQK